MSALFLSTYLFINCFRSFNVNYVFNKVNNTESVLTYFCIMVRNISIESQFILILFTCENYN